jgi:hypothetical protein
VVEQSTTAFLLGVIMANVSLGSILLAMGVPTRDNLPGLTTSDAAAFNQFVDNRRISQTDNILVGSEVIWNDYIFEGVTSHIALPSDPVPFSAGPDLITGFTAATGTFTMRDAWNTSNGVPAGKKYTLINLRGRGMPYDYRLQAARFAIESLAADGVVTEYTAAAAGAPNVYNFTVPTGYLDTVYAVRLRSLPGAATYFDVPVNPRSWHLEPNRGIYITAKQVTSTNVQVVLQGRVWPSWNDDLSTLIPLQRDEVVKAALEWMTLFPKNARENAAHQALMMDSRASAEYWFPNEERLY